MTQDTLPGALESRADNPTQLHTLNALLGMALNSPQELTREIQNAIDFTDAGPNPSTDYHSLTRCARHLLDLHGHSGCQLLHCDLRQTCYDPLWTRQRVLDTLQTRDPAQHQALVLFSGLPQAVCPQGKRWTRAREADYQQAQTFIEALCVAQTGPKDQLRLLFF